MPLDRQAIGRLLVQVCGSEEVLRPGVDLLATGLLDSLAIMDLFDELNLHGVDIHPTQVANDDLRTVDAIYALVSAAKPPA